MSGPPNEETAPQPTGLVERLVRDDVDRKRFLKMAGSAGAASFGAFVIAACGSSSSSSKTAATTAAATTSTSTSSSGAKGDIEIVVGEFRKFLETAVDGDGKSQSTILEIK